MNTPGERLWRPEQVADLLQVPVALLYKWRYSKIGPPGFKIGRYLRYRESDVLAWIDAQVRLSS
jgi:predicted DNA-binding transcriptional regulator AlpA